MADNNQDQASGLEAGAKRIEAAWAGYTGTVEKTFDNLEKTKEGMQKAQEELENSNAEVAAANATARQGTLSVSEALDLVEAERDAKRQYSGLEAGYLKTAAVSLKNVTTSGLALNTAIGEEVAKTAKDNKTGLIMATGIGAGLLSKVLPDWAGGTVDKMAASYAGLETGNAVDDGVEPKSVTSGGLGGFIKGVVGDIITPGTDKTGEGVGKDLPEGTEKEPQYNEDSNARQDDDDALNMSNSDLDDIIKAVDTGKQGNTGEKSGPSEQVGGLAAAVATGIDAITGADGLGGMIAKKAKTYLEEKLFGDDDQKNEGEVDLDGPDGPDA